MSKLKIGDRVRVYGPGWCNKRDDWHEPLGYDGFMWCGVVKSCDNNFAHVFPDSEQNADTLAVHPKQCRKLKPKQKKEPRRLFFTPESLEDIVGEAGFVRLRPIREEGDIEFVEVVK